MKHLYALLFIGIFIVFNGCKHEEKIKTVELAGMVFGTTYLIKYLDDTTNYQPQIDSLFYEINKSLSTYIPTSDISKINKGDTTILVDDLFLEVFEKSKKIYLETDGYFDPTVGNLVNAWGFGSKKEFFNLDSLTVKNEMEYVGLNKVEIVNRKVIKQSPKIYLDFNSIAKGYGIDVIGRFLEQKNIRNYLIEIGGEIRARGNKPNQQPWTIQLTNPVNPDTKSGVKYLNLSNKSMATSGNYRKFRVDKNGKKYVHTINPKTGFATESNLLSATVIAHLDCANVDAYATAFMAMGFEKSKAFVEKNKKLDVIFIYTDTKGNYAEYNSYEKN